MTQRQIYKLKAGNIARLKISTEAIQEPAPDEVQVKICAIGLNFADVFAILGLYSATPSGAFIPGLEYSGEIVALGSNVSHYNIGDRVMGVTRFGAYASHINIDQRYIVSLPKGWDYKEGASYLVQVLTAYYGLSCLGNLKNGQTALIHSAAGGVGIWANRICKQLNAYTIGTVGHERKLTTLAGEKYDAAIVRNVKSFRHDLIRKLKDRPLDLIMECIGGRIMKIGFEVLAPMGRHIVYGSAHYGSVTDRPNYFKLVPKYLTRPRIDPQNMITENRSVMAFNLIYLFDNAEVMHDLLKELDEMDLGRPIVGHVFQFEELPEAIRLFQAGQTIGKVVVCV